MLYYINKLLLPFLRNKKQSINFNVLSDQNINCSRKENNKMNNKQSVIQLLQ